MVAGPWPAGYACLPQGTAATGEHVLRPIRRTDAEPIRGWRNSQVSALRQSGELSEEEQNRYFDDVIAPQLAEVEPAQILFGFEAQGDLIGYGGLVHIAWEHRRAEISFLVDPRRIDEGHYREDMTAFLTMLKTIARDGLHLHRLFTETYAIRDEHIAILESSGLVLEGRLRQHVVIDGQFVDSLMHGVILEGKGLHD